MAFAAELDDIKRGIGKVDIAIWLATEDHRARYARTILGPWWNVLSAAVFVVALGITFGALFGQEINVILPYVAASLACWGFLNGMITDGCNALVRASGIISSYPLPLTTQVLRGIADKAIMFLHFALVYTALAVLLKTDMSLASFVWIVPGLILYAIAGFGVGLGLAVLGARYRDLGPALATIMSLMFIITPVFWMKSTLTGDNAWIVHFNPFYHFLEIVRQPMLGGFASAENWFAAVAVTAICLIFGLTSFLTMRRHVYFWI
jgi:ABC-type polysaccharide/polyol phosphate export permease